MVKLSILLTLHLKGLNTIVHKFAYHDFVDFEFVDQLLKTWYSSCDYKLYYHTVLLLIWFHKRNIMF